MNRSLMRAVVESLTFLGLSDDDVIQPDAAVTQMEEIAAILQTLASDERLVFANFVTEMAEAEAEVVGKPNARIEFLSDLIENLGI